jgi:hypothetical protein
MFHDIVLTYPRVDLLGDANLLKQPQVRPISSLETLSF